MRVLDRGMGRRRRTRDEGRGTDQEPAYKSEFALLGTTMNSARMLAKQREGRGRDRTTY